MIIGTSSIPYRNKFNANFLEQIRSAKKDGFFACELNTYLRDRRFLTKNIEAVLRENMIISVHANFIDNNISSLNPYMRRTSISQIKNDIIFAGAIKSKVVIVHPGQYEPGYEEDAYEQLNSSLQKLIPLANEHQTVLTLENMDGTGTKLFSKYQDLKKILALHPELKITLDFAHLGMTNQDISQFVDDFMDRIAHFHISGYFRMKPHPEISLRESQIDFRPYLNKIKNWDKIIVIENADRLSTSLSKEVIESVFQGMVSEYPGE